MTSITHQKYALRENIHKTIISYCTERPSLHLSVLKGILQELTSKMTLKELKDWKMALEHLPRKETPDA